jgi:NAD-dependent dihydropyrimidine dehydrogenase PreA subunit
MNETKVDKGNITIDTTECKGCGLCVEACVQKVLKLSEDLNRFGYHPAVYLGHGCNGCGLCYYACPEPGAITVYKIVSQAAA